MKLYTLPDYTGLRTKLLGSGYTFRRPLAAEKSIVVDWVRARFGDGWASETDVAFSYQPITCFIVLHSDQLAGFACYDAAYRNFFGPTGVEESRRGVGLGKILLMDCLAAMKSQGYAYAIIGGVGPAEFYRKVVGAELIPGSNPGIYSGLLSDVPVED